MAWTPPSSMTLTSSPRRRRRRAKARRSSLARCWQAAWNLRPLHICTLPRSLTCTMLQDEASLPSAGFRGDGMAWVSRQDIAVTCSVRRTSGRVCRSQLCVIHLARAVNPMSLFCRSIAMWVGGISYRDDLKCRVSAVGWSDAVRGRKR